MIAHIFHEALGALLHYRLRSVLTMLSIVWGVVSLVLLLAYGKGFEEALTRAFLQIGKDLVVVFPGQTSMQAGGERSGRPIRLELSDIAAITDGVPTIEAISPEVRRWYPFTHGHRTRSYSVSGVHPAFERIRGMAMASGRFLSAEDLQNRQRVVVIGDTLRKEVFSGLPALGSELKINGVRFLVVGILRKKTQVSNYASPDDMSAFVPLTTLSTLSDTKYLDNIVILPANNMFRPRIVTDVRTALARAHNFNIKDTRAVEILEWKEFLKLITTVSAGLQLLLAIIGTFTLSIGAVGVANIMLVSVAERTREIGVLKALGARRKHILVQVLLEGLVLTACGGLIGLLLSVVMVKLIGSLPFLGELFQDASGQGDLYLTISPSALVISCTLLMAVGMLAGMIPAVRAARLNPVQAIRAE